MAPVVRRVPRVRPDRYADKALLSDLWRATACRDCRERVRSPTSINTCSFPFLPLWLRSGSLADSSNSAYLA